MSKKMKYNEKKYCKFFIYIFLFLIFFHCNNVYASGSDSIKTKQYTITPGQGNYDKAFKLQIGAKKGYKVYYTTSSKFSCKKFTKPGRTKSIKINKDTVLKVLAVDKSIKLSSGKLNSKKLGKSVKKYSYYIKADGKNNKSGNDESDDEKSDNSESDKNDNTDQKDDQNVLDENGSYTSKDDVALYIHTYNKLPKNFITKSEAKKKGWSGGGLDDYAYGYCIGGDYFGNYEGILPDGNYHECDIDTLHKKSRGAKRIIYADDGRIYYTEDHYDSFVLLYDK